jgi:2-iminobutanoate/2-iminopropanoate deaminase
VTKEVLNVPNAPEYPFSPAIKAGDYIFVSGQGGFKNPETGETIKGIEAQTRQCLQNMKQVLEVAGASLEDVVKVTVFLGDVTDYDKMNDVYQAYFPKYPPARSTAVTGLVIPNMLIEMECIAYSPKLSP